MTRPTVLLAVTAEVDDYRPALTAAGFGQPDGWFTGGRLSWTSGANAGTSGEVRGHRMAAAGAVFDLWQRAPRTIAAGDTFAVSAGCDKRLTSCREKFSNILNFRGFPHMPGNDFVIRIPKQGEAGMDGRSLFR